MRTEAGKMPESLIFLTENSPGVSNDRFGLKPSCATDGKTIPALKSKDIKITFTFFINRFLG